MRMCGSVAVICSDMFNILNKALFSACKEHRTQAKNHKMNERSKTIWISMLF